MQGDYDSAIKEYEDLLSGSRARWSSRTISQVLLSDYRNDTASLDRAFTIAAGLRKTQVPQFKDTLGWVCTTSVESRRQHCCSLRAATELPTSRGSLPPWGHLMRRWRQHQSGRAAQEALELGANDNELGEKVKTALKKTVAENKMRSHADRAMVGLVPAIDFFGADFL